MSGPVNHPGIAEPFRDHGAKRVDPVADPPVDRRVDNSAHGMVASRPRMVVEAHDPPHIRFRIAGRRDARPPWPHLQQGCLH